MFVHVYVNDTPTCIYVHVHVCLRETDNHILLQLER